MFFESVCGRYRGRKATEPEIENRIFFAFPHLGKPKMLRKRGPTAHSEGKKASNRRLGNKKHSPPPGCRWCGGWVVGGWWVGGWVLVAGWLVAGWLVAGCWLLVAGGQGHWFRFSEPPLGFDGGLFLTLMSSHPDIDVDQR